MKLFLALLASLFIPDAGAQEFIGEHSSGSNSTSYTFSSVPLGESTIAVVQSGNTPVSSVTIGGVTASQVHKHESNSYLSYWIAEGVTPSGNVSVSMGGVAARCAVALYSVPEGVELKDVDSRNTNGYLSVDGGDFSIATIARNGNVSVDISTEVEDYELRNSGELARWGGVITSSASATFDFGSSPSIPSAILLSFDISATSDTSGTVDISITEPTADFVPYVIDYPIDAGGRLSVDVSKSVVTDTIQDAEVLYYVAHKNNLVPLHDGTEWKLHGFNGSPYLVLDASPSAIYDVFIKEVSGTLALELGDAWTGNERPSLSYVNGVAVSETALYVGTILTNENGNVDWDVFPTPVNGGTGNVMGVWNMYNRVDVLSRNMDAGNEYSYGSQVTRVKRGSLNNSITAVIGFDDDVTTCYSSNRADTSSQTSSRIGIGLDSTSVFSPLATTPEFSKLDGAGSSQDLTGTSTFIGNIGKGKHTLYALERAGGSTLWRDNYNGSDRHFQGMQCKFKM